MERPPGRLELETGISQGPSVPPTHAALCILASFSRITFFTRWKHGCWMLAELSSLQPRDGEERLPLLLPCLLPRGMLGRYFDWLTLGPTTVVQGIRYRLSQVSRMPTPQVVYPRASYVHGGFRGCWGPGSHGTNVLDIVKHLFLMNLLLFRAINSKSFAFPSKCKYFQYFNDCFPKPTFKITL